MSDLLSNFYDHPTRQFETATCPARNLCRGYTAEKFFEDIVSGMNFKRRGLLKVLKHCQTHAIKAVVIEFKDQLA